MLKKYEKAMEQGRPLHQKDDSFSVRHPAMPLSRRAKIFSPFDALKGFHDEILSREAVYTERRELSEEDSRQTDRMLRLLRYMLSEREHPSVIQGTEEAPGLSVIQRAMDRTAEPLSVSVTYFIPAPTDRKRTSEDLGTYETVTGILNGISCGPEPCIAVDGKVISLADIIRIECEKFDKLLSEQKILHEKEKN